VSSRADGRKDLVKQLEVRRRTVLEKIAAEGREDERAKGRQRNEREIGTYEKGVRVERGEKARIRKARVEELENAQPGSRNRGCRSGIGGGDLLIVRERGDKGLAENGDVNCA
jgi:hypothetical protein